ncbi:ATP-dependent RNA helicase DBP3 [Iris pallida]|uniref:ATP-dependent RNA helicase DBP3 n=1 Tax=Iris pallida TaxID=29817 RepID=A0AAX6DFE0_IRIPA|nr:ATP-dependent RNA helicase DBP3 [Iris pallida]
MAKGDDAVMRKRNRVKRKRMRSNESSSLSARVASIIASKRRRKAGKRRMCEGMCFSLPTPEDPFNDRQNNNKEKKPMNNNNKKPPPLSLQKNITDVPTATKERKGRAREGDFEVGCLSKFVILCLNAIQKQQRNTCKEDEEEEEVKEEEDRALLASSWGADFWRHCLAGSDILDTSGASANREQLAWLLSTASDLITRKEKQGALVPSPFLLYLVPCQQKSIQVRSMCKPLKDLGLHSVSLHPGVSIDHQIHGLKSCEPEFLISTPERLLELLSLRAIDISGVSLMVLDGLKSFMDFGFSDKVKSIRENISGQPQVVIFSDCYEDLSTSLVQSLLKGRVHKLSLDDSIASRRAFISQSVHLLGSEEKNISKRED